MSERVVDLTGVQSKAVKKLSDCDALVSLWGLPVREKIVRCKDCQAFVENATKHDDEYPHFCTFHGSDAVSPLGFCSWGERRAGDAE